jgi:hypothetical protein
VCSHDFSLSTPRAVTSCVTYLPDVIQ